jgi:hypothetical protein
MIDWINIMLGSAHLRKASLEGQGPIYLHAVAQSPVYLKHSSSVYNVCFFNYDFSCLN